MNFARRLHQCVIFLGCHIIFACNICTADSETGITAFFSSLGQAVASADGADADEFFNQDNATFAETIQRKFGNLSKLDSLEYTLLPHDISVDGNSARAIVFEKASYVKHDRGSTDVSWYTCELIKTAGQWRLDAMEERTYLQAEFADIDMAFDPDKQHMTGIAHIDVSILEPGETNLLFWLNRGLKIKKITDGKGTEMPFQRHDLIVEIPWAGGLLAGEKISLVFEYEGEFFNEFAEQHYCLSYIGPEGCFGNFVTYWYPQLTGTKTKSTARLSYTVPKDLTVASVGKFVEKIEHGDQATFHYAVTTPMDYTFNANRFFHYSETADDIQVNVYFIEGGMEKAKLYARESMKLVNYLKNLYGIFPYDSYNISEVPPEITKGLGGSGGQGLNFYPVKGLRDDVFEFPLIAHEVGHMWWGSWVMGDDKSGALISEGFSQLNAVFCFRHFLGEKAMWDFIRNGYEKYPQSAKQYFSIFGDGEKDLPLAEYDEDRDSDFQQLAYQKPHLIYTMLMEKIGYDVFVTGIRRIIAEYAQRRFDIPDFQRIMEEESGLDLDTFFDQWFHRTGAPEFDFSYVVTPKDNGQFEVAGTIDQLRDVYEVTAEIELAKMDYREIRTVDIHSAETTFTMTTDYEPVAVLFDPDYKILRWTGEFEHLPLLGKGIMEVFMGDVEQGVQLLTEFLSYQPSNMDAHTFLGRANLKLERYDEARTYFQFVLDNLDPDKADLFSPISIAGIAEIYEKTGDIHQATHYYKKTLELPNIFDTHAKAKAFLHKQETSGIGH